MTKSILFQSILYNSGPGSLIRFGSLLGGSIDGSDELQELGLDEGIYKVRKINKIYIRVSFSPLLITTELWSFNQKMSLENYR